MKMLIFRSFPDLREFRHPALWLRFPRRGPVGNSDFRHDDDSRSDAPQAPLEDECFLVQVTGSRGFFAFDCIPSEISMTETQPIISGAQVDENNAPVMSSIINSSGVSHRYKPVKSIEIPLLISSNFINEDIADQEQFKKLLLLTLRSTAIDNSDAEYNCQTWTELALRGLKEVGLLDDKGFERAVEELVEGIWEAEDDEM
jgi:hypothetical protein